MPQPDPPSLRGLWVPLVTPFGDDGSLDLVALSRLADRILTDGATGIVALGTTGEPSTMSADERCRVVETCGRVASAAGRPLVVGAGTNSTQGTIDEIRRLTDTAPAIAALVVVPYYTRPSEEAVVEHFGIVADESPVPVIMYNIPYRTGRGLGADALVEASAHPKIVGLKQSVGAVDHDTLDLLARTDHTFAVLAGDDAFITPTILMGGAGAIAAAAHVCTPLFVAMTRAALSGELPRARRLAAALLPVVEAGFAEPNPAVWKAALHRTGEIASSCVRRPMTAASAPAVDRLFAAIATAEVEARPR